MATKKPMSENSRKVLAFLQEAGVGAAYSIAEVRTKLELPNTGCATGPMTSFAKKGIVEKFEETVEVDGKVKTVKKYALTQFGADFNPDAPAEEG